MSMASGLKKSVPFYPFCFRPLTVRETVENRFVLTVLPAETFLPHFESRFYPPTDPTAITSGTPTSTHPRRHAPSYTSSHLGYTNFHKRTNAHTHDTHTLLHIPPRPTKAPARPFPASFLASLRRKPTEPTHASDDLIDTTRWHRLRILRLRPPTPRLNPRPHPRLLPRHRRS